MINKIGEITDIFNIFHDGDITEHEVINDDLKLTVEIQYLAERICPGYTKFYVSLCDYKNIQFETWPHPPASPTRFYNNLDKIFQAPLWILNAKNKNRIISVACSQSDPTLDYCGGCLKFSAETAMVKDEAGNELSIRELGEICESYWNEWEKN